MPIIRRIYLYAVSFVSLEVVLWGVIGLVRSILTKDELGGGTLQLARALSLTLVGVPVFLLHWRLAQRSAIQDIEERFSRIRAVFLYGTLAATLIPVVQNGLALVNRLLLSVFGLEASRALLGGNQTVSDNAIAMAMNALVAAYLLYILRANWLAPTTSEDSDQPAPAPGDEFHETRRLYRYVWLVYALGLVVFGAQQVLQFVLGLATSVGNSGTYLFANGLALLLIGTPIWYFVEQTIQRGLDYPTERQSILRLIVLYTLTFLSVGMVLAATGLVLNSVFNVILGARPPVAAFINQIANPLSIGLPLGAVWVYYGRQLGAEMDGLWRRKRPADKNGDDEQARSQRAGLRWLYAYVLAFFGLGATFIGLERLLAFILDATLKPGALWGATLRGELSAALSLLAVGTPLWVLTWRPMAAEAALEGEEGDHARRSIVRKSYLFLILFAAVIGLMTSTGLLLFQLFSALLGEPANDFLLVVLQQIELMLLFGLLLAYHWLAIRADARMAERSLAKRHAQFPVLVLAPGEGSASTQNGGLEAESDYGDPTGFAAALVNALQRLAPALPVAVHPASRGAPNETLSAARAVVLPAELIAKPSESLRLWLQSFTGARVVVPTPVQDWYWLFDGGRSLSSLARQAAQTVRHLAEGEDVPAPRESSPWMLVVYIFAALFALELILIIVVNAASLIFG